MRANATQRRMLFVAALAVLATLLFASRASAYVYWANDDNDVGSGAIGRANLDGSGVVQSFIPDAGDDPHAVAVDGSHVYWTNSSGTPAAAIGRANLDGTDVDPGFIEVPGNPNGVAVDGEHVYWSNAAAGIGRAALDGAAVIQDFIGAAVPIGVTVNGEHVFWTGENSSGPPTAIGRANLDGTGFDPNFIDAGQPEVLAVDAEHIYWTDPIHNRIGRANLDGTDADPGFIDRYVGMPIGVAVDAEHIYWTDSFYGTIGRAALDGTDVEPGFIGDGHPEPAAGVAIDSLLNDSATRVTCAPATPTLPGAVTCTATVTDTADVGALAPLGIVHFSSNRAGTFAPAAGCSLIAAAAALSICQLTYAPLAPGEQTIAADYAGDAERHTSSRGDATLEVLPQPPAPSGGGAMPEAKPSNAFTLAGPKLNRRRGTAILTATVPAAGRILLAGNGVKRARRSAFRPGSVKLAVRPNRRAKRRLTRRGRAKVEARVTYTPTGGEPNTRSKRLTLRLRRR